MGQACCAQRDTSYYQTPRRLECDCGVSNPSHCTPRQSSKGGPTPRTPKSEISSAILQISARQAQLKPVPLQDHNSKTLPKDKLELPESNIASIPGNELNAPVLAQEQLDLPESGSASAPGPLQSSTTPAKDAPDSPPVSERTRMPGKEPNLARLADEKLEPLEAQPASVPDIELNLAMEPEPTSAEPGILKVASIEGVDTDATSGAEEATKSRALVLDSGSFSSRAGFAGEEKPRVVRDSSEVPCPINRGIVEDWSLMESFWHQMFFSDLKVSPADHAILVTEPPLHPKREREVLIQLLFDTLGAEAVVLVAQAPLCLLASEGRVTGLVLDSGHSLTSVVPIYEGFPIWPCTRLVEFGGRDLTVYLSEMLRVGTGRSDSHSETMFATRVKEGHCYVAADYETGVDTAQEEVLEMADGQVQKVTEELFKCPEALFDPSLVGKTHAGMHELVRETVRSCDPDLRAVLLDNIVLAGGTTLFPGFAQRLHLELDRLDLGRGSVKIRVIEPDDPQGLAWQGGSFFAAFSDSKIWVSSEEYAQYGSAIAHVKCF